MNEKTYIRRVNPGSLWHNIAYSFRGQAKTGCFRVLPMRDCEIRRDEPAIGDGRRCPKCFIADEPLSP